MIDGDHVIEPTHSHGRSSGRDGRQGQTTSHPAAPGGVEPGDGFPRYRDLPTIGDESERCAWDVFGPGDERGTLNWIGPRQVARASRLVEAGRVLNLDLPLGYGAELSRNRRPVEHHLTVTRSGMDDWLDRLYLQSSSQWDGFRHVRYREFGYYGGHADDEQIRQGRVLGVDAWARTGIVGRGVLVDIPSFAAAHGMSWVPSRREVVTCDLLEAALAWHGVEVEPGDVVLVRTGWLSWYRDLDEGTRRAVGTVDVMSSAGLDPSRRMAEWLWDQRVAAVAADNPALEALPVRREDGFLHRRLLALLGMPIGELWDLDAAARCCSEMGRYAGLLVSSPLNLPGGAGSPCNAYLLL